MNSIKNEMCENFSENGFFHPSLKGSNDCGKVSTKNFIDFLKNVKKHQKMTPLKTRNFLCFFQHLTKACYRVNIFFSAPELTVFKILILSGSILNIQRFAYKFMLQHEDNRMRGWSTC